MKSRSSQIVLALFAVGLFLLLIWITKSGFSDAAKTEMKILMVRQAIGIFIATVAALVILLRALNEGTIAQALTLLVALFGGLTLMTGDWPAVIPLGLVIVGFVVIEVIRIFKPASGSPADQDAGGE